MTHRVGVVHLDVNKITRVRAVGFLGGLADGERMREKGMCERVRGIVGYTDLAEEIQGGPIRVDACHVFQRERGRLPGPVGLTRNRRRGPGKKRVGATVSGDSLGPKGRGEKVGPGEKGGKRGDRVACSRRVKCTKRGGGLLNGCEGVNGGGHWQNREGHLYGRP